jgi:hypothetical protein
MNESIDTFENWFWISLVMLVFYSWLLFLKTRRRETWLRYNSAEARVWSRFGLPRKAAEFARRFGEGDLSTAFLRGLVAAFALSMLLNAAAYFHFRGKLSQNQPFPSPRQSQQAQPSKR